MFGCIIIHAPVVFFPACEQWQGRNPPCGRAWCQILLGDTLLVASWAARGTNTAAWTQGALEMLLKLKKKRIERTIQNSSKNKTSWRSYAEIHWDHKLSKFFHAVHHCQDTRPGTIIQHSTGSTVKHAGNNPSQLLQKFMNNDSYIHFSTESFKCFHLRCILTASGFEIWHWSSSPTAQSSSRLSSVWYDHHQTIRRDLARLHRLAPYWSNSLQTVKAKLKHKNKRNGGCKEANMNSSRSFTLSLQTVELSVHLNMHWIDFLPHTLSEVTAKQRNTLLPWLNLWFFRFVWQKVWLFFQK